MNDGIFIFGAVLTLVLLWKYYENGMNKKKKMNTIFCKTIYLIPKNGGVKLESHYMGTLDDEGLKDKTISDAKLGGIKIEDYNIQIDDGVGLNIHQ